MGTISKFDHLIFLFKNNIFDNLEFEVKSLTLSPSNLISPFDSVNSWTYGHKLNAKFLESRLMVFGSLLVE